MTAIPNEAVEAAAWAHYDASANQYMPWEQIDGAYRNATYVFPMRAALEAAAPYLLAEFEKQRRYDALDSIRGLGSDDPTEGLAK